MPKQELVAFTREEFAEVKRLLLYLKRGGIDRPYYRPRWPILDGDNVQPLPSGDCDCCPGCVCYPEDEDDITDDCDAIGCLLKNYRIVANLPFSGTTTLAWDTGCIFKTASFNVTLCEDEDYGDHFWRLTVGAGIGDSTLELINDGGTDIPVEYVSQRPFRMLCATEFVFKEKCAIYADDYLKSIGHTWPTKLCVNPVGDTDCVACEIPPVSVCGCDIDINATVTFTAASCAALNGMTVNLVADPLASPVEWSGDFVLAGCGTLTFFMQITPDCNIYMWIEDEGVVKWGNDSSPGGVLIDCAITPAGFEYSLATINACAVPPLSCTGNMTATVTLTVV
jgi:hypothetical protein